MELLHHRHGAVLGSLLPRIERGQADGAFRTDVPAAWQSMTVALIYAGGAELRGPGATDSAETALVATGLGAVTGTRLSGIAAG